ncbi:MAG: glutamate-5-semialdehyde dehydrogenase [Lachnospiraceae bacterium]|nr:glutamate-5-semialdehyde dehydrogenase [Lachnospiraceae bacterium]
MEALSGIGKRAKAASFVLAALENDEKREALIRAAKALMANASFIIAENEKDMAAARDKGVSPAMLDRLVLNEKKINEMAEGMQQVASLPDPNNELLDSFIRPNGMVIEKRRVPVGVIGIIYESRPNVTADAFALTFRSGNACILRGGSDAINSNSAITEVIRESLSKGEKDLSDAVILIKDTSHESVNELVKMRQYLDLVIPRGGAALIRNVVSNSTVPVIETGTGNCHVYVDKDADLEKAVPIIVNGKTQRMGVCNAVESLVIHKDIAEKALPLIYAALHEKEVEIRGDENSSSVLNGKEGVCAATEEDYGTEYLGPVISVKTVSSLDEAIEHINRYSTHHSECIVTEDKAAAENFLKRVDAACVYHNVSTRFTDGFEFGFGAEIGISTQKIHARGPMGLNELMSYKYEIRGEGQIRP